MFVKFLGLILKKKKILLWMYFHSRKCDWKELYRSQSWYGNYDEAENLIGEATRSGTFMLWNSLMFIEAKEDSFSRGWQSVQKLQNAASACISDITFVFIIYRTRMNKVDYLGSQCVKNYYQIYIYERKS